MANNILRYFLPEKYDSQGNRLWLSIGFRLHENIVFKFYAKFSFRDRPICKQMHILSFFKERSVFRTKMCFGVSLLQLFFVEEEPFLKR